MNQNELKKTLIKLSTSPYTQIDISISNRLRALSLKSEIETSDLEEIIHDCLYFSLAQDIAINVLNDIKIHLEQKALN